MSWPENIYDLAVIVLVPSVIFQGWVITQMLGFIQDVTQEQLDQRVTRAKILAAFLRGGKSLH